MARLLPLLALIVVVTQAPAQQAATPAYDLQAAVRTALEKHPALQAAGYELATARARVQQARARGRLQITAEAGYTRLQDDPTFTVAGMGTLHFGAADNWTANLGLEYPLYTGGKLQAMRAAAEAGVLAESETLQRQEHTIARGVALAFYRLLTAERMLPVSGEQVTALTEALRTAQALSNQGMVAKIDVLRAQVALTAAQAGLEQRRAERASASALLVQAMGLPPGTAVAPREQAAPADVPELTAELWQRAWRQRPDLQALQARRQALQAQVAVARSETRPQIGAFARSEFERPTFYPDTGVLSGGVMIRQRLSDGGATRAAVAEAQARLEQLDRQEEELRYGIAAQVQVAASGLRSAQTRVATAEPAVALAREALRLAQIGYANGVTPVSDVLQAQSALAGARADYETALLALGQAWAELHYALGDPTTAF